MHDLSPSESQPIPRNQDCLSEKWKHWEIEEKSWSKPCLLSGRGGRDYFWCWTIGCSCLQGWADASPAFFQSSCLQFRPLNHSWWGKKAAWCSGGLWCNYQQADCMYFLCRGTFLFLWQYSGFGEFFWVHESATCTSSTSDELKAIIWEENMSSWQMSVKPCLENDSEVEKSISMKTQKMKFRTEFCFFIGSQIPHRYSSHWQWYLWESQVYTHSPNSPCPGECLDSDQLLFPSHSAPLLKHEGNSHPCLPFLPSPLPHTRRCEKGSRSNESSEKWGFFLPLCTAIHLPSRRARPGLLSWELLVTCHSLLSLHVFPPLSIQELEKQKMKVVVDTESCISTSFRVQHIFQRYCWTQPFKPLTTNGSEDQESYLLSVNLKFPKSVPGILRIPDILKKNTVPGILRILKTTLVFGKCWPNH